MMMPKLLRHRLTGRRLAFLIIALIALGFLLQISQGLCPTP